MARETYDVAIIGGGSAGLTAARVGVALGAKIALIDRSPAALGGDCLHTGCVPSKALIHAARAYWDAGQLARWGLPVRPSQGTVDLDRIMAGVREVQAEVGTVDTPEALGTLGVALAFGQARFVSPALLTVDDRPLVARRYVIATDSRPTIPDIPGLDAVPYHTNESIFALTALPARLLVIGGGPIGCELGQAFARLGSQVTIIGRAPYLLPRDDREASLVLEQTFVREGLTVITGGTIEQIADEAGTIVATVRRGERRERYHADAVLVATGRTPSVAGLDLARASVAHDSRGIAVDRYARTTNPRIYAAGDVLGHRFYTQIAGHQGSVAVVNALLPARMPLAYESIPWATFTSPEVVGIGLTLAEAERQQRRVLTTRLPYRLNDRALAARSADDNFIKLIHDRRGTILGAQIVGPGAGETINEIAIAMSAKLSLSAFSDASHVYPTLGLGLQQAALNWRADSPLARWGRPVLRAFFGLRRRLAR
jgi:pyruvate/2-oxoglutarate dehydrogenase complex dihydrolipoamide dehydrogenase (E3) component